VEIAPVPRRPPLSAAGRVVLLLVVLLPVTLLTLVPVMLGLDRYVVMSDAMGGSMGRGSVVYVHRVPVSDLEVGDVITFTPPGAPADSRVTRRVVSLDGSQLRTRGDARSRPDPWTLPLDGPTQAKVVLAVPLLGYPFVGQGGRTTWLLTGVGTLGVCALVILRSGVRRRRVAVPAATS
jgi:signal peptidase